MPPHLALLMMLKNEEARIHVSLNSVLGFVQSIVIFDTGSTDNTLKIVRDFCDKNKIALHLKEGEFTDFSTARNISLDFADTINEIDFLLLLDCNDELQGGHNLLQFLSGEEKTSNKVYLLVQQWQSARLDKYYNSRLIRARCGWRYKGSVHEWLCNMSPVENHAFRVPDDKNIVIYQDRNKDNNKSGPRFARDKVLLLSDHTKDLTDTRTLFYLAQTCSCLNENDESFYYYKLRSELDGFWEEKFHSYLRCGELSQSLNHDWHTSLGFYMKALEYSTRAEPALKIAQYYQQQQKWTLAFTFANLACSLEYPTQCILFVDKYCYDYLRWHILGIISYYAKQFEAGKQACLKAIAMGINVERDTENLKFYEEKKKDLKPRRKWKK